MIAVFRILVPFLVLVFALTSCRRNQGASNPYKDARKHPSDQIAKEHKKGSKKAHKIFLKTQKKNKKKLGY
ncbi:MAG: hypothetical protein ACRCYO_14805 [Bacteroidia bacterium]